MNGTFITTGGEIYFIAHDTGSYYRYDGETFETQPISIGTQKWGGVGALPPVEDDWGEVAETEVGDEVVTWEGEETELKVVYQIVQTELENTKN